jgi:hypothetical protein
MTTFTTTAKGKYEAARGTAFKTISSSLIYLVLSSPNCLWKMKRILIKIMQTYK